MQYQHPDRLGTKLITNASGGVISEQAHLPFGTALPLTSVAGTGEGSQSSSQPNPHQRRFTSYERSTTTNLDYAVNRHYAAEQGRFTQVDPIGMAAVSLENPQTLNLYAYCANDPVNQTDPSGLLPKWLKKLLKVAMIVLAVITAVVSVLSVINTISMIVKMSQFLQFVSKFPLLANALGVGSNLGASSALKLTLTLWKGSLIKGVMALTASVVSAVSSVASIFDKSIPTLGFIGTIAGAKGGFWGIYKVITGTASQIAKWVGAKKASAVLAFSSIIDSLRGLLRWSRFDGHKILLNNRQTDYEQDHSTNIASRQKAPQV